MQRQHLRLLIGTVVLCGTQRTRLSQRPRTFVSRHVRESISPLDRRVVPPSLLHPTVRVVTNELVLQQFTRAEVQPTRRRNHTTDRLTDQCLPATSRRRQHDDVDVVERFPYLTDRLDLMRTKRLYPARQPLQPRIELAIDNPQAGFIRIHKPQRLRNTASSRSMSCWKHSVRHVLRACNATANTSGPLSCSIFFVFLASSSSSLRCWLIRSTADSTRARSAVIIRRRAITGSVPSTISLYVRRRCGMESAMMCCGVRMLSKRRDAANSAIIPDISGVVR